ncbi:unnamed protein product [Laminaria digitata]
MIKFILLNTPACYCLSRFATPCSIVGACVRGRDTRSTVVRMDVENVGTLRTVARVQPERLDRATCCTSACFSSQSDSRLHEKGGIVDTFYT